MRDWWGVGGVESGRCACFAAPSTALPFLLSPSYAPNVATLLDDAKARVLIYVGQNDFICNWFGERGERRGAERGRGGGRRARTGPTPPPHPTPGNLRWLLRLQWSGLYAFEDAPFADWRVRGVTVGEVKNDGGALTYVNVAGAGHMVPMDAPAAALAMIQGFTRGERITGGEEGEARVAVA